MSVKLEGDNFASLLTDRPRFHCSSGSREAEIYEIKIDKKGHKVLECTGTKDIYEDIQSYAEECDLKKLIARASAGDTEALNQRQGFYADITEAPKTLAEAQNIILKLSNEFDQLPKEIKEKFDNSKEVFIHQYGTESWAKNMGLKTNEAPKTEKVDFIPDTSDISNQILTPEVSE